MPVTDYYREEDSIATGFYIFAGIVGMPFLLAGLTIIPNETNPIIGVLKIFGLFGGWVLTMLVILSIFNFDIDLDAIRNFHGTLKGIAEKLDKDKKVQLSQTIKCSLVRFELNKESKVKEFDRTLTINDISEDTPAQYLPLNCIKCVDDKNNEGYIFRKSEDIVIIDKLTLKDMIRGR